MPNQQHAVFFCLLSRIRYVDYDGIVAPNAISPNEHFTIAFVLAMLLGLDTCRDCSPVSTGCLHFQTRIVGINQPAIYRHPRHQYCHVLLRP
jgi:hypothetical protein